MIIPDSSTTKYERHVTYRCVCVCVYLGQVLVLLPVASQLTNLIMYPVEYQGVRYIVLSRVYCFTIDTYLSSNLTHVPFNVD